MNEDQDYDRPLYTIDSQALREEFRKTRLKLTPRAAAILQTLLDTYPLTVPLTGIAQAGGFGGYRARITEIRKALAPYGWDIENDFKNMTYKLTTN
jgi:hypothetical protein